MTADRANAQVFPSKYVRIVVPYPAGGGTDIVTRIVADGLAQRWTQQVIVDNRPGASGNIGAEIVSKAPADGHTLLVIPLDLVINSALFTKLSYDALRDFAPISSIVSSNLVIAAHPSLQVNSVAELVAKAKRQPGRISYASCGNGTPQQIVGEMLKTAAGIHLVHVPYKGCAPAQLDAISGHVALVITAAGNLVPFFRSGKLVPLAVTATVRHSQLPEVPTMIEAGFADFSMTNWMALLAPAKTPAAVIEEINAGVAALLADPIQSRKIVDRGFDPFPSTPAEMRSRIERDKERFGAIVRQLGVRVD